MDTPTNYILYLLHFEPDVRGKRHYCGIARADNFKRRIYRHMTGHGSKLVARALDHGCAVYLATFRHVSGFDAERAEKQRGHFKDRCPICTGQQDLSKHQAVRLEDRRTPRQPTFDVLNWSTASAPGATQ